MRYLKEKHINSSTYCWYRVYDKDNNILTSESQYPCFRDVMRNFIPQYFRMEVFVPKHYVGYEEKELQRWTDNLNVLGLEVEYKGEDKDGMIVWNIPLLNDDGDRLYRSHAKFILVLSLVRYTYHENFDYIIDTFFQIQDELPEEDIFIALMVAHTYYENGVYMPTGHLGMPHTPCQVITLKQFNDFLNTYYVGSYPRDYPIGSKSNSIYYNRQDCQIRATLPEPYKERIELLKQLSNI